MPSARSESDLQELEAHISAWLATQVLQNPAVAGAESGIDGLRAWFVRLNGEAKETFSARLELGQRTLSYETYFLPYPEENFQELFEQLLRRNEKLYGMAFTLGSEDAIYLRGQMDNALITADGELDRVLGSLYEYSEQAFPAAVRLGFASRFTPGRPTPKS